jgi:hypothetical protein
LFSQVPLFYIDSPFHWYQVSAALGFCADGAFVGYDPWFAAGHVGGVNYNASAKMPALLASTLSPWLSTTVAYIAL